MATLYSELRAEMKRKGVKAYDIAVWLNLSERSVHSRLSGDIPWTLPEMYLIMDKLHIPLHKLHIVFPQGGMWAGPLEDPPPGIEQQMLNVLRQFVKENAS